MGSVQRAVTIVGGGLAGSEAAWQVARSGFPVRLYEMRPVKRTPAHQTGWLAELVCSNSFKSRALTDASGLLKEEMRRLGSLLIPLAEAFAVPAGQALAVDRERFAQAVTARLEGHPLIEIVREEITTLPEERPLIVATGPLTSDALAGELQRLFGDFVASHQADGPWAAPPSSLLAFYDAISPIVSADSIDFGIVFAASRYGKGGEDYLNCPMTREEYLAFWQAVRTADLYPLHDFEETRFFEACLPIEELAGRGEDALRYGPMRPVGLIDPRTGRRPYAVVQLRQENQEATMYNMVGFQTRMRRGEQKRIFRMIPGLEKAEFLRYGSIHRNTFIPAPVLLKETLQFKGDEGLFFAGQLIGVEGYLESAGTGLLAGFNAARLLQGKPAIPLPPTTSLGSLLRYIVQANPQRFQPMNVNFGLLPPLPQRVRDRHERNLRLAERALQDLEGWIRLFA